MSTEDKDEPIDVLYRSEQTTLEEKREIFSQLENKEKFITEKIIVCHLLPNIHEEFRIFSFRKRVTMSLILKCLVEKMIIGDSRLVEVVNEILEERKQNKPKKLTKFDADSIYDLISEHSTD